MREEDLLNTSLEPTFGFETQNYDFFDVNISLFDASGQEMDRWLDEQEGLFSEAELVVFFFSVKDWTENVTGVQDYLTRLNAAIKDSGSPTSIAIFCHKMDQITTNAEDFKKEVQEFTQNFDIPVFFTSIAAGGNQDLIFRDAVNPREIFRVFLAFHEQVTPLLHQFDLHPIFIFDKHQKIAVNLASEAGVAEKLEALKLFYLQLWQNYEISLQESPSLFATWLGQSNFGLICADFAFLHPDLANVLIKANTVKAITGFFDVYQNLREGYEWQITELDPDKHNNSP